MPRPNSVAQEISLFRSRIQNRWVDDVTIRVLESILVSKDVQSSIQVRSVLKKFMRDESLLIFNEIAEESAEIKLVCTEFLIRVFAMIGDVEICLALRYEALVMRDERATTHPELQVTRKEWSTFAEHSLENGFHSIANQACEKALMCSGVTHLESDDVHAIKKVNILKDTALLRISSQSVQAQAKAYMKQKKVKQSPQYSATSIEAQKGSLRFRNGIKKHNLRKLHDYQRLSKLS
ncbi:hypothetical protein C2S52_016688 [Perilla frutescens var. hirtella]|nr:hypothetical protein C2S52_016688 [Perilla frutescens var. hirtella]